MERETASHSSDVDLSGGGEGLRHSHSTSWCSVHTLSCKVQESPSSSLVFTVQSFRSE